MTRVAAYCRVSTDKTDQNLSFNSQKLFFSQYIENKPEWVLTEIYADEGITGTTTAERTGFLKMIDDAARHNFELIITKEVSRFSRNILDAISFTRRLKAFGVGVIFLNDGISTLDPDAELRLGIMASVAQEESRRTSERVRWGQLRQMERGVVFGRSLLGYDVKNGKITLERDGAEIVRRIFSMYLNERLGVRTIAKVLTENKIRTKSGGIIWSGATVLKIIRNEKYCGDLLQKKTITADYLTHKKRRNRDGDLVYIRDHHEPIIDRVVWEAAQSELKRRAHYSENAGACGNRYALSGKIFCAGCGASYHCRTRKRKDGNTYRVWSCLSCSCRNKHGYIREDVLAQCIRHIIKSYGKDALINSLSDIIARIFREQDTSDREYDKGISLMQGKLIQLVELYLAGDIARESYLSLKLRYEDDLERLRTIQKALKAPERDVKRSASMQVAVSLALGEDSELDFYLSLVDRAVVMSDTEINFFLVNLAGTWCVEFQ